MKQIKVDLSELEVAFDNSSDEMTYYLNTETGEVVVVTDEARSEFEAIEKVMYGGGDEVLVPFDEALGRRDLDDELQHDVRVAAAVEAGFGTRYVEVPRDESRDGYRDMEAFIDTVADTRLQDRLERAIDGRGAFRRFKDELRDAPVERERWFAFQQSRVRERILEWLADEEIEPVL